MNIQYGCGLCAPESWENFDASFTITLQRLPLLGVLFQRGNFPTFPKNIKIGNIARGLNVADSSANLVYCSHVLEHLTLEEFRLALRETRRILKAGGTFRFVLPDLEEIIKEYTTTTSEDRAFIFMESTLLGTQKRNKSLSEFLRSWLGRSRHLWMWDYESVKKELIEAGFSDIRRAQFGDSDFVEFKDVEDEGRWIGCLGVECKK